MRRKNLKSFHVAIRETERAVNDMRIFTAFVSSIFVFSILALLMVLLDLPAYYSLFPSLLYLIGELFRKFRIRSISMVERLYPSIDEELRTAIDNSEETNEIVMELQNRVVKDMKQIESSSFFSVSLISRNVVFTIIASWLVIFVAVNNIHVISVPKITSRIGDMGQSTFNEIVKLIDNSNDVGKKGNMMGLATLPELTSGAGDKANLKDGNSIYGEKKLAKLGDEEKFLKIKAESYDVMLRDEEKKLDDDLLIDKPSEFNDKSAELSSHKKLIVKNYFKRLTEG